MAFTLCSVAAHAQFAGSITLASKEMFRGESVGGNDPALSAAISFDHDSGLFAGASASMAAGSRDPYFLASNQYAGFALRRGKTSIELGVIHRDYDAVEDADYSTHYAEAFVGLSHGPIRARVYVSSDYLLDGSTSYYGEVEARLGRIEKCTIGVHGGLSLLPPETGTDGGMRTYVDWNLHANRPLGKFSLSLGVSGTNYPVFGSSKGPTVFASINRAF